MFTLKKTLYSLGLLAMAATAASCNDIEGDDRFIELPAVEAKRVVLLEEFTGQMCVNCPEAHAAINELLGQYPENLIVVGIHSGGDAFSWSEDAMPGIGLRTVAGQKYCDDNNIKSLPAGIVNRTSGVTGKDQWASLIRSAIAVPSNIDMDVTAELAADGKTIEISTGLTAYAQFDGNLQLWVTESGIVSPQLTPTGMVAAYTHNHVLRGTVNGQDGEPIAPVIRERSQYSHTVTVKDTWNVENLSIVAFVYDKNGVLQAAECHVQNKKAE